MVIMKYLWDDVFQLDGLVDSYRVALTLELEENLIFHVDENIFVDIDATKLNDILRTSGHT
jgi:hypothetical protein